MKSFFNRLRALEVHKRETERELKTSLKIQGEAGFIHEIIQAGNLQRSRKLLFMRNII